MLLQDHCLKRVKDLILGEFRLEGGSLLRGVKSGCLGIESTVEFISRDCNIICFRSGEFNDATMSINLALVSPAKRGLNLLSCARLLTKLA